MNKDDIIFKLERIIFFLGRDLVPFVPLDVVNENVEKLKQKVLNGSSAYKEIKELQKEIKECGEIRSYYYDNDTQEKK